MIKTCAQCVASLVLVMGLAGRTVLGQTYTISGWVKDGNGDAVPGVTVAVGGQTAATNDEGVYSISELPPGDYLVIPGLQGQYLFDPPVRQASLADADVDGQDFVASAVSPHELYLAGVAAIYLAGRIDVVIPEPGGDLTRFPLLRNCGVAPCEGFLKERFPMGISLAHPNEVFTFAARGAVAYHGPGWQAIGPDGDPGGAASDIDALGGIGGYSGPAGSLVGVFLSNNNPAGGADPGRIDFSDGGFGTNFAALAPALGQVFFIGNGTAETGGGVVQRFTAPDGASRLLLGIADAANFQGPPGYYDDNPGAFPVAFNRLSAAYSIGGRVTDGGGAGIADVVVSANGYTDHTNSAGDYVIPLLAAGDYTVVPAKDGYLFAPIYRRVTVGPSRTDADFVGTAVTGDRIPGSSAIFLAGRSDVTIPPFGGDLGSFPLGRNCTTGDGAGYVLEQRPREYAADGGDTFTFSAGGAVDYYGNPDGGIGPDGDPDGASNIRPLAGISGYRGPNGALVGMFYFNANPNQAGAPATLDFSAGEHNVFTTLAPQLGQVFFIGNGTTASDGRDGVVQQFIAPRNATRLFIGIADANGFIGAPGWYDDNLGAFAVTVNRQLHPTYTVGGQITYAGFKTGSVHVDLCTSAQFAYGLIPGVQATGTGPWSYSFPGLEPGTGPGYLRAFMDTDGNGLIGAGEPIGVYAGNPVPALDQDRLDCNIVLTDPSLDQVIVISMLPRSGPMLGYTTPATLVAQAVGVQEGATQELLVVAALGTPPYHYAWTWRRGAAETPLGVDDSRLQFQPGFDTVTHPTRAENTMVVCTVTDSAGRSVATATWAVVQVADTDQDATAPVIGVTPANPRTTDDLTMSVITPAEDLDGDTILGYVFDWRRLNDGWMYSGTTLPAVYTHRGETWEGRARATTDPYGYGDTYSVNAGTLQVTVGNTPATAVAPLNLAVAKNGEMLVTLGAQDPDRDDGLDALTFALDALPANGDVLGFDASAGTFTYTPHDNYVGIDSFWFSVSDGIASSASVRADILVYGGWVVTFALQGAALPSISFGVEDGATDGVDNGIDVLCPSPSPGETGAACFVALDGSGRDLARDIRGQAAGAQWLFEVAAAAAAPVFLSWVGESLPADDLYLWQVDANGNAIAGTLNAMAGGDRTLEVPAAGTRHYAIGFAQQVTLNLRAGWNLVSVPFEPLDPAVEHVFDDHSGRGTAAGLRAGSRGVLYNGHVYGWNPLAGATGGYEQVTAVQALHGYWIHLGTAADITVIGVPAAVTQLTLQRGWNLLGVPADTALPAGVPGLFLPVWGWDGLDYQSAPALVTRVGYWFYATQALDIPLAR